MRKIYFGLFVFLWYNMSTDCGLYIINQYIKYSCDCQKFVIGNSQFKKYEFFGQIKS